MSFAVRTNNHPVIEELLTPESRTGSFFGLVSFTPHDDLRTRRLFAGFSCLHGGFRMTRVWFSLGHSWIVHHQIHVILTPCNDIKNRLNVEVVIIASHSTLNILLNNRSYVFSKWPVLSQSLPRCRTWRFICHWERR